MAMILCTGVDKTVLEMRKLILETAGHTVITVMNETSLNNACNKHSFDVAIIGQMIPPPTKRRIAILIKQHCPDVKILELYLSYPGKILEDADSWLLVPVGMPQELGQRVNELAGKGKYKRAKI